jgi:hypothetical protein
MEKNIFPAEKKFVPSDQIAGPIYVDIRGQKK